MCAESDISRHKNLCCTAEVVICASIDKNIHSDCILQTEIATTTMTSMKSGGRVATS